MLIRAIIRALFLALFFLPVIGWAWSYRLNSEAVYYNPHARLTHLFVGCNRGEIYLTRLSDSGQWWQSGWAYRHIFATIDRPWHIDVTDSYHLLGFYAQVEPSGMSFIMPFWFPTAIAAVLLWLVWRKTRPRLTSPAFPLDTNPAPQKTPTP